ncbi:AMP-dependent synthetase/ligase [Tengunoibacter tsumagoiensis]|uniref:AMP-dependent synthetase/ligase domain-containing protein n=1 Tax=Tengunoibacter tsumagoiensis TaxID=2014871 RepID=A0A401ZWS2_9CHLR|nr:AMP-binding protein [Tengunoibacter tsumagoiensis]GCE11256.1 hypothetical protein KTT_11150 [Tengunoibacter tsumagoiensis]
MSSIPGMFAQVSQRFGTRPAVIEPVANQQLSTLTYSGLQTRIEQFAGYLQQLSVPKGERIMIWSPSSSDWLVAYFGALLVGLVVVPLDVNTKEDFLARLVDSTEAHYLIATQKLFHSLKHSSLTWIDIESLPGGNLNRLTLPVIHEDDLAELVFTSGTTGQPKGVMLSHKNILSNAHASVEAVQINEHDRALSILPLSHMFEMTIDMALLSTGASIVYARSLNPDVLFNLLETQHITCMVLVPQALQLFMNGIEREIRRKNMQKQWELLHRVARYTPFSLRRYIFRAIHKRFGGHFRLFVSGGAYLPPKLGLWWENMGFRVLQGYGATECSPVISVNPPHDHNLASVGKPIPGVEIRLDADQEVLVKGPNVALGYWQNPEATAAAFQNGWYRTGDLGYLDEQHTLYLKGRKKNLIVLGNGMNVYPEDLENILQIQEGVKDAIVLGKLDEEKGPEVHAVLLMEDTAKAKQAIQSTNKLVASHQQIRGFTIWPNEDFPRTNTLKVKRQDVYAVLQTMPQGIN